MNEKKKGLFLVCFPLNDKHTDKNKSKIGPLLPLKDLKDKD